MPRLMNSYWPKFHHDLKNTGLSPYLSTTDGTLKWSYTTGGWIGSSPAIDSNRIIYIGSGDNNLYAINPDGTLKWSYTTGGYIMSSPAIDSNGVIYVGSYDHKLYAINPDGTLRWNYIMGNDSATVSSPAIDSNGTIYVGGYGYDNKLYAINPDGTLKWSYTTGGLIESSPAIDSNGVIYIGSYDKNLYAINPDGTLKWSYKTGNYILSSPAIDSNGVIYVGSWDGKLYAINPDGTLRWSYTTGGLIHYSSPAIDSNGVIYIGSYDKNLYAINPDGTLKWSYTTGDSIDSSPAIDSNRIIYIGSGDNKLYAINPDGTLKWSYTTGGYIMSSPAIDSNGVIYIGSGDNTLYAFSFSPIIINPSNSTVATGHTQQFTAICKDQNGNPIICPTIAWDISDNTLGTIDSTGLFTANISSGTVIVTATIGTVIGSTLVTIYKPANIISAILTVDTNDCMEPCTINGTVSWTNNGDLNSPPTDLSITTNGISTSIASAVVIDPGEIKSYTFYIPNLIAGTYSIQASPNSGASPQTITVRTPANIVATTIIPSKTTCTEPCDLTVDVTWTNIGGATGTFIPSIKIDGTSINPAQYALETLIAGNSVAHLFNITGLSIGSHIICADPDSGACAIITVEKMIEAGFGGGGIVLIAGLAIGAIYMAIKKTKI